MNNSTRIIPKEICGPRIVPLKRTQVQRTQVQPTQAQPTHMQAVMEMHPVLLPVPVGAAIVHAAQGPTNTTLVMPTPYIIHKWMA